MYMDSGPNGLHVNIQCVTFSVVFVFQNEKWIIDALFQLVSSG